MYSWSLPLKKKEVYIKVPQFDYWFIGLHEFLFSGGFMNSTLEHVLSRKYLKILIKRRLFLFLSSVLKSSFKSPSLTLWKTVLLHSLISVKTPVKKDFLLFLPFLPLPLSFLHNVPFPDFQMITCLVTIHNIYSSYNPRGLTDLNFCT